MMKSYRLSAVALAALLSIPAWAASPVSSHGSTAASPAIAYLAPSAVSATQLVFDVSGIESYAAFGSPENMVFELNLAPYAEVTGIAWDVNLTAFSPSYLSEAKLTFTDSAITDGVDLTVGVGDAMAGTADYSGDVDLAFEGLNFNVGADGKLRLEFWESYNDSAVSPDGVWNYGTVTFTVSAVPEPATYAMFLAGVGVLGAAARRRRNSSSSSSR